MAWHRPTTVQRPARCVVCSQLWPCQAKRQHGVVCPAGHEFVRYDLLPTLDQPKKGEPHCPTCGQRCHVVMYEAAPGWPIK